MVDIQASLALSLDGLKQSTDAVHAEMQHQTRILMAQYAGEKWLRLPLLQGRAVGGALNLGSTQQVGPLSGFAWSIRRLVVSGLTTGANPDIVNFFWNDPSTQFVWQLNGNSPGSTFGRLELVARPGEMLYVQSQGAFAATGLITVSGELTELPAEQLMKLAG